MDWLHGKGIRFELMFHRQAYQVGERFRFWGGLAVGVLGGKGLVSQHLAAARTNGIEVRFRAGVTGLTTDGHAGVAGVLMRTDDGVERIEAGAVVLASGGFEADPRMRAGYLGAGWDLALVRGTPYNTGDGIRAALEIGAQSYGQWSGCIRSPGTRVPRPPATAS